MLEVCLNIEIRSSDTDHLKWLDHLGESLWREKKILDVGCGSGYLCKYALEHGASHSSGIDILSPPGYSGREKWEFLKLDLDSQWADEFKKSEVNQFDIVLAFDIIEHLNSPFQFLKSCLSLLSPDGVLVLTTPNTSSWERLLKPDNWSGCIDPQHKILFNIYSLKFLLAKAGFEVLTSKAPVRSLKFLNQVLPGIGGQIFLTASPEKN